MTDAMGQRRHSEAESLAAFVDGGLQGDELASVAEHLQSCEECRLMIGEAAAFERETHPRRTWLPYAAAAAVMVIVAAAFLPGYLHRRTWDNGARKLLAMTPDGKREIEGRFSGQTAHGEYHRMRGGVQQGTNDEGESPAHLELQEKALNLVEDTKGDHSPAALRAHAMGLALYGERKEALDTLNQIPPNARDAATWNDIAAIEHQNGQEPQALAAVNTALKLQPTMREALFNRALILTGMEHEVEARAAWVQYLAVDSNSGWADEARSKIEQRQ